MQFKTQPYDHQLEAFDRFKNFRYFALFKEMGTGKTKIAIDIASYMFLNNMIDAVLLIAPNGVHRQWANDQVPAHSPIPYKKYIWDSRKHYSKTYSYIWKEFLESSDIKWFCTNVEYYSTFTYRKIFERFLEDFRTIIIVDESTRIKNPKAKRTKNIISLANRSECRVILTGTPVTQSPIDIWAQFEFLKRNFFERSYFVFQHHHSIMVKDLNQYSGKAYHRLISPKEFNIVKSMLKRGDNIEKISAHTGVSERNIKFIKNKESFTQYKNVEEIKEKIKPYSIFTTKEECLDLPPKIFETILVEPSPEQKSIYNKLKKELLAEYASHELSVQNKVSLTLRLMQICGGFFPSKDLKKPIMIGSKNKKIERLKEDLYEIGDERVIVWSHFVAEIEALYNELSKEFPNWNIEAYYGKTEKQRRSEIIEEFQAGKIKILIANQQTASFGLNLQKSTLHYFYSNNFSLEQRLQAEDRSHRAGQEYSVCYKDILLEGTIEDKIIKSLQTKKDILDYFRSNSLKEILS